MVDLRPGHQDLDMAKRRGQKAGDPAWRRLERCSRTSARPSSTSDFEDYDIGVDDEDDEGSSSKARGGPPSLE